jgi:hypothetical protein
MHLPRQTASARGAACKIILLARSKNMSRAIRVVAINLMVKMLKTITITITIITSRCAPVAFLAIESRACYFRKMGSIISRSSFFPLLGSFLCFSPTCGEDDDSFLRRRTNESSFERVAAPTGEFSRVHESTAPITRRMRRSHSGTGDSREKK